MAEPESMLSYLSDYFSVSNKPLNGINALVTAGPTYERIDPVRFIGNFSTGKMGVAIANCLAEKGANVTLVLGPSHLNNIGKGIQIIHVESAAQMFDACTKAFNETQIAVLAAAVADYKPALVSREKIKKSDGHAVLNLAHTEDILAALGKIKHPSQTLVGFALETDNELENALKKLKKKNADMIVLNSLNDEGAGFGYDTNKITILKQNGATAAFPLQTKKEAAEAIINQVIEIRHAEKILS
jgi:phosphopantothenoylcysteine decarboxylase/phosphopantothenate--cysteine ligase